MPKVFWPNKVYRWHSLYTEQWKWNVLCRTLAHGASLYFSDPFQTDAKHQVRKFTFPNTSALMWARPLTAQTPSIKSPRPLREGFSATTRSIMSFTLAVVLSISSSSVLSLATVLWMHHLHFPARALFVLHRLIHFKLLPNSSPLPPLESSPFVPQRDPEPSQATSVCLFYFVLFSFIHYLFIYLF